MSTVRDSLHMHTRAVLGAVWRTGAKAPFPVPNNDLPVSSRQRQRKAMWPSLFTIVLRVGLSQRPSVTLLMRNHAFNTCTF